MSSQNLSAKAIITKPASPYFYKIAITRHPLNFIQLPLLLSHYLSLAEKYGGSDQGLDRRGARP